MLLYSPNRIETTAATYSVNHRTCALLDSASKKKYKYSASSRIMSFPR